MKTIQLEHIENLTRNIAVLHFMIVKRPFDIFINDLYSGQGIIMGLTKCVFDWIYKIFINLYPNGG